MADPVTFLLQPGVPVIDQHFLPWVLSFVRVNPLTSFVIYLALRRFVKWTKTKEDDKWFSWLLGKITGSKRQVIEDGATKEEPQPEPG